MSFLSNLHCPPTSSDRDSFPAPHGAASHHCETAGHYAAKRRSLRRETGTAPPPVFGCSEAAVPRSRRVSLMAATRLAFAWRPKASRAKNSRRTERVPFDGAKRRGTAGALPNSVSAWQKRTRLSGMSSLELVQSWWFRVGICSAIDLLSSFWSQAEMMFCLLFDPRFGAAMTSGI